MTFDEESALLPKLVLTALRSAAFGAAIIDMASPDASLIFANPAFADLVGRPHETLVGRSLFVLLEGRLDCNAVALREALSGNQPTRITALRIDTDGTPQWQELAISPVVGEGQAPACLLVQAGPVERRQVGHLSSHDLLTGLPTRQLFETLLTETVHRQDIALFKIDFQEIQEIGEAFGSGVSDAVVVKLSERCTAAAGQRAVIARIGRHRFAILEREPLSCPAEEQARRLSAAISEPMVAGGQDIVIMPSIGVATHRALELNHPEQAQTRMQELLKQADIALSEARRHGASHITLYTRKIDDRVVNRAVLRQSLYQALSRQQFELHYQPQVDLRSGEIVGAEALVRWNHPTLGWQRPDVFIPLAEETGQIIPLGLWIVEQAFRQSRKWNEQRENPLVVAINLSGEQLADAGFLRAVERLLVETGADPSHLEFELTESVMIDHSSDIQLTLHGIRALGIGLAIDDFGTGYASLRYLKDIPATVLKIDQTFVRNMIIDANDVSIVRSILILARKFDLKVVAEGIETRQQLDFLRRRGCSYGQGYFFSMPLRIEDFEWLLRERPVLFNESEGNLGSIA